ncbi:HlyD family efflux transporter periplasmic adaptor subunit, partial [Corallococcus exiguus]|uniref:efflux RND transporter periplasmic adaptor subunit n=1 Tax=Corallococcus exiguus TaxID=83462 RepID=UPI0014765620
NQQITEGTVLVQLDDSLERADLQDVQAAVKLGEASYERAKTLTARGFGTEASYDEIVAKLATARSRQNRLQAVINQKSLKAPFTGVIGIPRVDVGQYVQTGTVVGSFQNLDSMKVDFTVPEQQADRIK